jgi:hypothetical protein
MFHFSQHFVLTLFEQAAAHFPIPRVQQPLPEENVFVVSTREELPPTRVTTAQPRGGLTARGRANMSTQRGRGGGRQAGRGRATT